MDMQRQYGRKTSVAQILIMVILGMRPKVALGMRLKQWRQALSCAHFRHIIDEPSLVNGAGYENLKNAKSAKIY